MPIVVSYFIFRLQDSQCGQAHSRSYIALSFLALGACVCCSRSAHEIHIGSDAKAGKGASVVNYSEPVWVNTCKTIC